MQRYFKGKLNVCTKSAWYMYTLLFKMWDFTIFQENKLYNVRGLIY